MKLCFRVSCFSFRSNVSDKTWRFTCPRKIDPSVSAFPCSEFTAQQPLQCHKSVLFGQETIVHLQVAQTAFLCLLTEVLHLLMHNMVLVPLDHGSFKSLPLREKRYFFRWLCSVNYIPLGIVKLLFFRTIVLQVDDSKFRDLLRCGGDMVLSGFVKLPILTTADEDVIQQPFLRTLPRFIRELLPIAHAE